MRADACPGALQTHDAADGALARVRTPGGAVSAAQLRVLGAAAREVGVDVIELTSRANLQVRGVRDPAVLANRLAGAGLLPSASHERVRNIVASPLGGRGIRGVLDTDPLVTALDRAVCANPVLADLPGRFLFAVDDGTGDVVALGADVALTSGGLLLAGTAVDLEFGDSVAVMVASAEAFLQVRGDAWRLGEVPDGPRLVAKRLGGVLAGDGLVPDPPAPHAGIVEQRDGRVALEVVPPLGRMSGAQVEALAEVVDEVRLTPWRSVVLRDLERDEVERCVRFLERHGFATDADSPWVGVTACTGSPGCAKSRGDVQGQARRWVDGLAHAPRTPVHWAGCDRCCGMPRGPVVLKTAAPEGHT
ncbi:precorrin-3B synthase [Actinomadura spongiicola]|uniref:Precorrin-3B synthase n=1 Tax=Actinomadura spongiicola TaxID=2303421 RepID=A0A372G7X1_9ACTN|nr:precorrin-3B synthase [Actinomadura spongiicola]RFS81417.1 precorrin-3B synthase [Actinomadura spongiicola]